MTQVILKTWHHVLKMVPNRVAHRQPQVLPGETVVCQMNACEEREDVTWMKQTEIPPEDAQ